MVKLMWNISYQAVWTIVLFVVMSGALTLASCSKDSGLSAKSSVWDNYDFRHPVPYGAPVPDSRADTYDQYSPDYEQYYVPPKGYYAPQGSAPAQPPAAAPYSDYEEYYVPPKNMNYNPCIPGDPGCIAAR